MDTLPAVLAKSAVAGKNEAAKVTRHDYLGIVFFGAILYLSGKVTYGREEVLLRHPPILLHLPSFIQCIFQKTFFPICISHIFSIGQTGRKD